MVMGLVTDMDLGSDMDMDQLEVMQENVQQLAYMVVHLGHK